MKFMQVRVQRLFVGIVISAVLITAGCAAKTKDTAANNENGVNNPTQGQAPGNRNGAFAMTMGKIKSVSDSKITIYPASVGMNRSQGAAAGNAPEGAPTGESGTATDGGKAPADPQSSTVPGNVERKPGGQRGNGFTFSEETIDLTITSDTKIKTSMFEDNQRVESDLPLASLKEGDIIQYTLKDQTEEAESISLSSGFPGGGMQGQAPGDTVSK